MNTKISLSLILFLVPLFFCQAQNVALRTPKGNAVLAPVYSEYTNDDYTLQMRLIETSQHPNVIVLREASHAYNCHSYAWNITKEDQFAN